MHGLQSIRCLLMYFFLLPLSKRASVESYLKKLKLTLCWTTIRNSWTICQWNSLPISEISFSYHSHLEALAWFLNLSVVALSCLAFLLMKYWSLPGGSMKRKFGFLHVLAACGHISLSYLELLTYFVNFKKFVISASTSFMIIVTYISNMLNMLAPFCRKKKLDLSSA